MMAARRPEVRAVMRMPVGIELAGAGDVAVEVAFDSLREVDATFGTYREDSEISRLDRGELTLAREEHPHRAALHRWPRSRA